MSTEAVYRPSSGSRTDSWGNSWVGPSSFFSPSATPTSGFISVTSTNSYGKGLRKRRLDRPKSVPPTLHRPLKDDTSTPDRLSPETFMRPNTATGMPRADCDRVYQVEHEPTRKQQLDTHLTPRKAKSAPWQRHLDSQPIACVVTPGYTLTKSKDKIHMTIKTEQFFDPEPAEKTKPKKPDPERDGLITELQQQVADLQLYLEEERLNHRQTKQHAAEELKDRVEEMREDHRNEMNQLRVQQEQQLDELKEQHMRELAEQRHDSDTVIVKMKGEIEFLHGAFESYKSQLLMESDEKWRRKEEELKLQHEENVQEKIHQLKSRLITEKNIEADKIRKEHSREIQTMRREHKKEMDGLVRRFSNAAADVEKLKETQAELKTANQELEVLRKQYDDVCGQVTELTRDLTDTKVKLISFEESFEEKVQTVDDRYKQQIHDLMSQNTELRRLYVKKCGQLFDEQAMSEKSRIEKVETAKETMKMLITTRNKAMVSMAAGNPDLEKLFRPPKERPASAPQTKQETKKAYLSAGETDEVIFRREERARPQTSKPRILQEIANELEGESEKKESETLNPSQNTVEDLMMKALK